MPLEEIVDSLEGIDENYHDLYVKNDDGKFEINIDGLKSALAKERNTRKKLEKKTNDKDTQDPDLESLKNELQEANNTIKNMKVSSTLKNAALSAGVDADYVDDVISLTKSNFNLSEDGSVIHVDADGEPTGKSPDNFFNSNFKKSKPRFYTSSGRSGSGSQSSQSGNNPLTYDGKVQKAIQEKDVEALVHLKQNKIQN